MAGSSKTYAATTASGMLSVAVTEAHTVSVTVSDGDDSEKKTVAVRRNKKPVKVADPTIGDFSATDANAGNFVVGTQHPHNMKTVPAAALKAATGGFMDDDTLTYSAVTNIVSEGVHVMLSGGKEIVVTGLKSTGYVADVDPGNVDLDPGTDTGGHARIAVDVTATDTGGLTAVQSSLLMVGVDEAPKLSGSPTMRDVAIKLTETASSPLRFVRVEGQFEDPDTPTGVGAGRDHVMISASSTDPKIATVEVICATEATTTGVLTKGPAYRATNGCDGTDTANTPQLLAAPHHFRMPPAAASAGRGFGAGRSLPALDRKPSFAPR